MRNRIRNYTEKRTDLIKSYENIVISSNYNQTGKSFG